MSEPKGVVKRAIENPLAIVEERAMLSENGAYSNQMVDAMSRQFHAIMDKYIPYDMAVMDSV